MSPTSELLLHKRTLIWRFPSGNKKVHIFYATIDTQIMSQVHADRGCRLKINKGFGMLNNLMKRHLYWNVHLDWKNLQKRRNTIQFFFIDIPIECCFYLKYLRVTNRQTENKMQNPYLHDLFCFTISSSNGVN